MEKSLVMYVPLSISGRVKSTGHVLPDLATDRDDDEHLQDRMLHDVASTQAQHKAHAGVWCLVEQKGRDQRFKSFKISACIGK